MLIGDLLIQHGVIKESQLLYSMRRQIITGDKIGQCLIHDGFLDEGRLLRVLGIQLGYPFVESISDAFQKTKHIPYSQALKWPAFSGEDQTGLTVFVNDFFKEIEAHLIAINVNDFKFALARTHHIRQAIER